MVRRFVEQQHVGGTHELARQAESSALAAAQLRDGRGARGGGIEAESVQHRVDARRDRVAAFALEALEILAVAVERRLARVVLQPSRLLDERLLEREQVGELPAAASHTVVAPPNSRCCSRSETRMPGCCAI